MGLLAWMVIAAFLAFLVLIFAGLVLGFWLSELTQSYVKGFGITTIILILFFIFIAVFREKLFVNPIIRSIILRAREEVRMREKEED
jgi:F0F1-type ATP synthase assembly protein I